MQLCYKVYTHINIGNKK